MIKHGGASFHVTAVILAGGTGQRMGGDLPKQYLLIGGAPILAWAATAFERAAAVDDIVLVVPASDLALVADRIVEAYKIRKARRIVSGGSTRQESMCAGLAAIDDEESVVLIHDGVRPFVSGRVITEAALCAAARGSALVATPIGDTVKRANERGEAVATIPREALWAAQTPQAFRVSLLRRAAEEARAAGYTATDEAMLVERLGIAVPIIPGEPDNLKVTTPDDLLRAEEIARRKEAP